MKPQQKNGRAAVAGVIGLVLLFFGQVAWFAAPKDVYALFPIESGLGTLCLAYFLLDGGALRIAGFFRGTVARARSAVIAYAFLVLGIIAIANVIASRHGLLRYDTTESQVYTLAPETNGLLNALEHPLIIRGFFPGGKIDNPRLRELLELLRAGSPRVSFEIIDPEKKLTLLEQFGISQANTLHFTYEIPEKSREAKVSRILNEETIANALKKLLRSSSRIIYYVSGHGEPDIEKSADRAAYTFLRESIEGENIELKRLALGNAGAIPDDAAGVILAAPKKPLDELERGVLEKYLETGGHALLLSEVKTTDEIARIAERLGVTIGRNVVVDELKKMYVPGGGLGVEPLVSDFANHPITKGFKDAILLATASSVSASGAAHPAGTVTELARSSANSWAETNLDQLFSKAQAARDADDVPGPVSVAAAFEGAPKGGAPYGGARAVIIGDSDFVNNGNIAQLYNRDFFLNAMNWIIGEDRGLTIRARTLRASKKGLSEEELSKVFLATAVLFPEAIVLLGLVVWWRRRS